MVKINDKDYTIDEIQQIFHLCRELLEANETMRANVIAMSAKLENEESKVKKLTQQLYFYSQAFTNNTYNA
jgi:CRISPR/Cas system CSM-associated protein Csm5 (group 7 of RAMP superfamily)